MEEILFWVLFCLDCELFTTTDCIEETKDGDMICPHCGKVPEKGLFAETICRSKMTSFGDEALARLSRTALGLAPPEKRLAVISDFCWHCGKVDPQHTCTCQDPK